MRPVMYLAVSLVVLSVCTSSSGEAPPAYGIFPASSRDQQATWQRLVCSRQGCQLHPVDYGTQNGESTIAFLSGYFGARPGAVPTWFTGYTPRNPGDVIYGSLGVTLRSDATGGYRIVPRWNQKTADKWLTVYLETRQQRQRLGQIGLEELDPGLKPRDIVIWAGDLDGDGKLDLITRVRDTSTRGLHLWLSSLARKGEMVGIAASLDSWTEPEEM